jgi:hypothetical protein
MEAEGAGRTVRVCEVTADRRRDYRGCRVL